MKKALFVLAAVAMVCLMTSSAMAFVVTNRSAEMTAHSPCDQAGTIKMSIQQADWDAIGTYLMTHDYAEIRITITGTDLDLNSQQPVLCKDIHGTATASGVVPNSGELVKLDTANEYSTGANPAADFDAYVWGDKGDQIIHVYFTYVNTATNPDTTSNDSLPWFQIGLYTDEVDVSTAICADVTDFSGFNKLTISNETVPQGLAFSGDNEIGHFGNQDIIVRDCDKDELDECSNTSTIQLCTDDSTGPNAVQDCPTYTQCVVADGDFPTDGDFTVNVTSDTPGVYLVGVDAFISSGSPGNWDYYEADCDTSVKDLGDCAYEAKCADSTTLSLSDISSGTLQFCITYEVNPAEAVAGDVVEFTVSGATLPCGALFSGTIEGPNLVKCQGIEHSMYFPYVLTGAQPWSTGIVVTNMGSDSIPAADMVVTFTLTDSNGDVYTKTVNDFTSVVWSGNLDQQLAGWGWAPAAGNAWLQVMTNFPVDGYCYLTNGSFGAGTLPRLVY